MFDDIKHVVVATDFSETAGRAVDAAIEVAKNSDARLHIVHAFETPVPIVSPYEIVLPEGLLEEARESALRSVEAVRDKASAAGVTSEAHLAESPASHAIVEYAKQIGADLLVIGTRGHTGLKHVLLGSVAERTVRAATCPVLVVGDTTKKKK